MTDHNRWKRRRRCALVASFFMASAGWLVIWFGSLCPPGTGLFSCLVGGTGPVVLVWAIWYLIFGSLQEKRERSKAYEDRWREVCVVIGGEHNHDGTSLKGHWGGRAFRAHADTFYVGNGLTSRMYSVSMSARRRRAAWRYDRLGSHFGGEAPNWVIRTDDIRIEQHLGPELVSAIQQAERTARHFRAGARLSYDPRHEEVVYEDDSGEVPCAHDFLIHLELVRRVVETSDAIDDNDLPVAVVEPRTRVWLSVAEPPTWLYALLLPACIAALVGVETSSSWMMSLLPLAIAAPYAWRVRIGRR